MSIGARLRILREEKGLRQEDVGNYLAVQKSTVSQWENDVRTPDSATIVKLAKFFGVTTDYLLGNEPFADRVAESWPEAYSVLRRVGRQPTLKERRRIAKIIEVSIKDEDEDG